jgi:hypothetical protein
MFTSAEDEIMGPIWLAALLTLSVYSVIGTKGLKWKLLNPLIILASIAAGLGVGALAGAWGKNMAFGGELAVPLMLTLGTVAAIGCVRRNHMRAKKDVVPPGNV